MPTRIAINGFGRIGRLVLRTIIQRHKKDLTVVAVNDMADLKTNVHLFRYDSTYGVFPGKVSAGEGVMQIDGQNVAV
jgi:glyceraldehyde 3-phosphate dehydrogenase